MPTKLTHSILNHRMECYFALFGTIISVLCVISAVILTPGFDIRYNTISSLGFGRAKSLFSIGLVVGGCMNIPFFIYLEREFVNVKENLRRLATGTSIFTSVCIALSGIIPDETYLDLFIIFHGIVAAIAFTGSCVYITLYSILMHQGPKSKLYTGPAFKKFIAYYGISSNIPLIIYFITGSPLAEWVVFFFMVTWLLMTVITLLEFKFFNIAGIYYRKKQYPEALELFEESLKILNKLD